MKMKQLRGILLAEVTKRGAVSWLGRIWNNRFIYFKTITLVLDGVDYAVGVI